MCDVLCFITMRKITFHHVSSRLYCDVFFCVCRVFFCAGAALPRRSACLALLCLPGTQSHLGSAEPLWHSGAWASVADLRSRASVPVHLPVHRPPNLRPPKWSWATGLGCARQNGPWALGPRPARQNPRKLAEASSPLYPLLHPTGLVRADALTVEECTSAVVVLEIEPPVRRS
jgi:hypothetical protein